MEEACYEKIHTACDINESFDKTYGGLCKHGKEETAASIKGEQFLD
jgi:hypothetical protein